MGRVFWGILIAGVLLATPGVRHWLEPHVLPLLDPLYEWRARSEVEEISRLLQRREATGKESPSPRDLPALLDQESGSNASLDPWGTPFYLHRERRSLRVGSAGRDRVLGTGDDILSSVWVSASRP